MNAEVGRVDDSVDVTTSVSSEFGIDEVGVVIATALVVEHESGGVGVDTVASGLAGVFVDHVIGTASLVVVDVEVADSLAESPDLDVLRVVKASGWSYRW